jgi:hypothetical protein
MAHWSTAGRDSLSPEPAAAPRRHGRPGPAWREHVRHARPRGAARPRRGRRTAGSGTAGGARSAPLVGVEKSQRAGGAAGDASCRPNATELLAKCASVGWPRSRHAAPAQSRRGRTAYDSGLLHCGRALLGSADSAYNESSSTPLRTASTCATSTFNVASISSIFPLAFWIAVPAWVRPLLTARNIPRCVTS